jgi:hypothetical protein
MDPMVAWVALMAVGPTLGLLELNDLLSDSPIFSHCLLLLQRVPGLSDHPPRYPYLLG